MASSKPKENGKSDAMDNTRRALQFNERTDRSLHAELSHLERNRKEIMRDLRKIQQIKTTLNDQLRTVLEHKKSNRSISDSGVYMNGLRLPSVGRHRGRRHHSDVGPMDRLIDNERCRLEKLGTRCEPNLKGDGSNEDGYKEVYRTNQDLRNDIFIKSRFAQLGGKYIGKEFTDKRSSLNEKRRKFGVGTSGKHRASALTANQKKSHDVVNKEVTEESEEDEIGPKLTRLSIRDKAVDENRDELDTSRPNSGTSTITRDTAYENITVQTAPSSNDTSATGGQNHQELSPRSSVKGSTSLPPYRKTSAHSVGWLDIDSMKTKQEALLPIIPPELRSKRRSKALNSLEQAFMVCRDVSAESRDIKSERKRRFANLVDLVVKQRRVINAWEPLMRKIGEIHSDDEV